jgi:hypothetical protein
VTDLAGQLADLPTAGFHRLEAGEAKRRRAEQRRRAPDQPLSLPVPSGSTIRHPYWLPGPDRHLYASSTPGILGGHRRLKVYGRLDCPSAQRALVAGGYARWRVFFASASIAQAAGYRPCVVCLPQEYRAWKAS